ncbi:MAG: hypothetical protein EOO89_29735, partial [Pedobacter sp.]
MKNLIRKGLIFTLLFLSVFLYASSSFAQTPSWTWARGATRHSGLSSPNCIGTDATGSIYVAEGFDSGTNLDPDSTFPAGMFLIKWRHQGNIQWKKHIPCEPRVMVTDSNGNCYIAGSFYNLAIFGNDTLSDPGNADLFIAKFDSAGNALWARRAGSPYIPVFQGEPWEGIHSIAIDSAGNCYVGMFLRTSNNQPAMLGTFPVYHDQQNASPNFKARVSVVAKYSTNGDLDWVQKIDGSFGEGVASGLAVSAQGDCFITGSFKGTATLGGTPLTSNGDYDTYYAKLDTDGNFIWVKSFGSSYYDSGTSVAVTSQG